MSAPVRPDQVERRLIDLSRELDEASRSCEAAEFAYFTAKGAYEVGVARARITIGRRHADVGVKVTVQEREDEATLETADLLSALYTAEATVRAARANVGRIKTQVDLARSVSVSVRASMEVS